MDYSRISVFLSTRRPAYKIGRSKEQNLNKEKLSQRDFHLCAISFASHLTKLTQAVHSHPYYLAETLPRDYAYFQNIKPKNATMIIFLAQINAPNCKYRP